MVNCISGGLLSFDSLGGFDEGQVTVKRTAKRFEDVLVAAGTKGIDGVTGDFPNRSREGIESTHAGLFGRETSTLFPY